MNFIRDENSKGKTIFGMGASTKGNTLLQYYGLTPDDIVAITEVNKDKYGLKTVGTAIPIISDEDGLAAQPDYFLVLPWHFNDNFIDKNQEYLESGGKFIVPCPEPAIISNDDKRLL